MSTSNIDIDQQLRDLARKRDSLKRSISEIELEINNLEELKKLKSVSSAFDSVFGNMSYQKKAGEK